jgi:hypothetical protein
VGCFGDLFCDKLSPFCQKKKELIILPQFSFLKKNPHNWKKKKIAKNHHN